jgi:hypothetical protein
MSEENEEKAYTINCRVCGEHVEEYDSAIEFGVLTGELDGVEGADCRAKPIRFIMRDKHIRCSPSRAQRIMCDEFPQVVDDRPEFDMRLWDKAKRDKWVKVYTDAWIRLQERHNPEWKKTDSGILEGVEAKLDGAINDFAMLLAADETGVASGNYARYQLLEIWEYIIRCRKVQGID